MTKLYLATDGDRPVWVVALIDQDIWTYVANTDRFHRNEAMRDDFFVETHFGYREISVREALRHIQAGVGRLDEEERAEALRAWRSDPNPLLTEMVLAAAVAGES